MDTIKIAQLAQEFMAMLEHEHGDDDLVEVGIVVELRRPSDHNVAAPTACTNDSRVYQTGLFQWAVDSAQWTGERADDSIPGPDES